MNEPIDTSIIPPCAGLQSPSTLIDLDALGTSLMNRWESKEITNVYFVKDAIIEKARINQRNLGDDRMNCRDEIIARNHEINRLRARVAELENAIHGAIRTLNSPPAVK